MKRIRNFSLTVLIAVLTLTSCASQNPLTPRPDSKFTVQYIVRVNGPIDMTIRYLGANEKVEFINWNDVKNLFNEKPASVWTKTIPAFNGQKIAIENFLIGEIDVNSNTKITISVYVNSVLIFEVSHRHKVGIEFFIYDGIDLN